MLSFPLKGTATTPTHLTTSIPGRLLENSQRIGAKWCRVASRYESGLALSTAITVWRADQTPRNFKNPAARVYNPAAGEVTPGEEESFPPADKSLSHKQKKNVCLPPIGQDVFCSPSMWVTDVLLVKGFSYWSAISWQRESFLEKKPRTRWVDNQCWTLSESCLEEKHSSFLPRTLDWICLTNILDYKCLGYYNAWDCIVVRVVVWACCIECIWCGVTSCSG